MRLPIEDGGSLAKDQLYLRVLRTFQNYTIISIYINGKIFNLLRKFILTLCIMYVQLTLEQRRFDCKGLLIHRYFSIINTAVLHYPWLVKSTDAEKPQIWRTDYKLYAD